MQPILQLPLILALTLGLGPALASAAEPAAPQMLGSLSCSAAACHGNQPVDLKRPVKGEEFVRWLEMDPHAKAAQTLAGKKYRQILVRVSNREDGEPDRAIQLRCAKCHDPLAETGDHTTLSAVGHGIGCETCHGAGEHWLAQHYERGIEPNELLARGMLDTKNLLVRGKQCVSCHVGSAAQDMNHDMIAAGHPPLRFEMSAYHDLIQHKHWNDTRERLETRDFQAQLWGVGQTVGAAARLDLLSARCGHGPQGWPELAEYNCFSCHQRIRGKDQLTAAATGRPDWSTWNLLLVKSLPAGVAPPGASGMEALRAAFSSEFPVEAQTLQLSLAAAKLELERQAAREFTAKDVLQALASAIESTNDDWESRCQQYLALAAVERTYRDELAKRQHFARLSQTEYNRRLLEEKSLIVELQQVRTWLQFEPGLPRGNPAAALQVLRDEPLQFHEHRSEIGGQLKRIADRLQVRMLELP